MELSYKAKYILKTFLLAAILIAIMVGVSQTLGLSRSGFSFTEVLNEALTQFYFYIGPGDGYLLGILILTAATIFMYKDDDKYGLSLLFNTPGEAPSIKQKFLKSSIKILWLSIIIFTAFGLYGAITKQTFFDVGVLKQQFTFTDNLIYSSALVPISENLQPAFFTALYIFILLYLAHKKDWKPSTFWVLVWVGVPIIFGMSGYLNHLLRYADSDVSLRVVLSFWVAGGIITVLFGSFIPFWINHLENNLFYSLSQHFSNDVILLYTVGFEILLIIGFVYIYLIKKKSSNSIT
jgi:hypothetical protein